MSGNEPQRWLVPGIMRFVPHRNLRAFIVRGGTGSAQGRCRSAEIRPPQAGGGMFQVGRDYPVEDGDLFELHT